MARVKSNKPVLISIPDWEQADLRIRLIGDLQMQISQAEKEAKDDINEIKAELAKGAKSLQEEIKLNAQSLEAFAATHSEDFGKKRSKKLSFGILGWRKSTSIRIAKNTLELIKKVLSRPKAYIHIKESVNKDALAKLADSELKAVRARREEKEVFFVEPALHEAADYCE